MHQLEDASVDAVYSLKCTLCWMGACCRPTQSTSTVTKIASGIVTPRATDAACGSVSPHRGDGGGGSPTAIPGCAASECGIGGWVWVWWVACFGLPPSSLLSHTSRPPTTNRAGRCILYQRGRCDVAAAAGPAGSAEAPALSPAADRSCAHARSSSSRAPPRAAAAHPLPSPSFAALFLCAKSSAQQRPHLA